MIVYSDPHFGLTLNANTTPLSRLRLRKHLLSHVCGVLDPFREQGHHVLCAGDFFDKHQNSEEVIASSLAPATRTDWILSGNHDVTNSVDRVGSLDLLRYLGHADRIVPPVLSAPLFDSAPEVRWRAVGGALGGFRMYLVPHHASQDLFEATLDAVAEAASTDRTETEKLLVMHCNYDSPAANDRVSLNLSKRRAEVLLKVFPRILLGHEHAARTDFDGRLIVIGSPHPTGFGDVASDKFVLEMSPGKEPVRHRVWKASDHYLEVDHASLLEQIKPSHRFIRVTGEVPASDLHKVASAIKAVWTRYEPFAVRSDVIVISGDADRAVLEGMSPERLRHIIATELQDSPDLLALWEEISRDQVADAG